MATWMTGQHALRQLPPPSYQGTRTVASYELPSELRSANNTKSLKLAGIAVQKVTKNGKLQARRLAIASNNRTIFVSSNRVKSFKGLIKYVSKNHKQSKAMDISQIQSIQRGPLTNRFLTARACDALPFADDDENDDHNCLSIIYRVSTDDVSHSTAPPLLGGHRHNNHSSWHESVLPHRFETLDLHIPDSREYDLLLTALEELVTIYRQEAKTLPKMQLWMEFHWLELDNKPLDAKISEKEFLVLAERMSIPFRKSYLSQYFTDYCRENGLEADFLALDIKQTQKLVGELLEATELDVAEDALEEVWLSMVETDPLPEEEKKLESAGAAGADSTISNVAFLSFVRSTQKEYSKTLQDVDALWKALSWGEKGEGASVIPNRWTKARFRKYVFSDANDWVSPTRTDQEEEDDMTHPLSAYWINTSHDTYLARQGPTWTTVASSRTMVDPTVVDLQAYPQALVRGARAVECRVWDGIQGEPVVARKQPATAQDEALPLFDVLRVLRTFLQTHPDSYPILLLVENHCSVEKQQLMARDLTDILGSFLYKPNLEELDSEEELPSPEQLRGKIVIKDKRPKSIQEGGTVVNDDFDEEQPVPTDENDDKENDDDDDFESRGVVIGFDASGPVRSAAHDDTMIPHPPAKLLKTAKEEAAKSQRELKIAQHKVNELDAELAEAERISNDFANESGLAQAEIKRRALAESYGSAAREEGEELDLATYTKSLDGDEKGLKSATLLNEENEGLEVQDFFGEAVEGAKTEYSEADRVAVEAKDAAKQAKRKFDEAELKVEKAMAALEASFQHEKDAEEAARKAAVEARENREHADTAKHRVRRVRVLLQNVKSSASSAETVVVTAMTEAKISEQRAAQTEARASRAQAIADRDRSRANTETRKEEEFEQEAAKLHEVYEMATKKARGARERMEKAANMLDRLNEQIKLIENSSQYRKEVKDHGGNGIRDHYAEETTSPRKTSKFVAKHATKMDERKKCTDLIREASRENSDAEAERRRAQQKFEDAAQMWKRQADLAAAARKQADRSSQSAEELAEHAEEEREAATLRHVAREKAQSSVKATDSNKFSAQAQLAEAERASTEAEKLAVESRSRAERLAKEALKAKDHSKCRSTVERRKEERDEAWKSYELAKNQKSTADNKASTAKRLYETSSEVFSSAKQTAAFEIHEANIQRQAEKAAVRAYSKFLLTRKQSEQAKSVLQLAQEKANSQAAAARHAQDYKARMDKVVVVSPELARLVTLHSTKYRRWEQSMALPCSYMHSLSDQAVAKEAKKDEKQIMQFTQGHMLRTYPRWGPNSKEVDPVYSQSLGCQLVGMNFMSATEALLAYDGRFRANESCGYVLKPPQARDERPQSWKLSILSGSYLPKPESEKKPTSLISPLVRISLYEGDGSNLIRVTKPVKHNGVSPVWGEKDIPIEVTQPSVAILLVSIWDSGSSDFVAASSLPIANLREGYRTVALFDSLHSRCGPYAFSTLFVHVRKVQG